MFLRKCQRTEDGKRHTCFALVESRRTERGPRQQIVAHLGELTEDQEHRWQRTILFHTRHDEGHEFPLFMEDHAATATQDAAGATAHDPYVVRIRLAQVGWSNARAFGDVWLGWQLRRKLELDGIVDRHIQRGRETVSPATMVAIEVISRLCNCDRRTDGPSGLIMRSPAPMSCQGASGMNTRWKPAASMRSTSPSKSKSAASQPGSYGAPCGPVRQSTNEA